MPHTTHQMLVMLQPGDDRRGQCSWLPRQVQQITFPARLMKLPFLLDSSWLKADHPNIYIALLRSPQRQ